MFKRANKITALLVAAASVMSMVPAMAADSTRLGTKEGTIEDAIAFKDGKYVFEGYKTDDNSKSVYYNDGEKDKEINDLTDATIDDNSKYDASSTITKDGNDEYLLDLSNGKVTDEDVASDLASTAKDKLTTKLKKTARYGDDVTVDNFDRITPDQFGDVWYAYTGTKKTADSTGTKAIVTVNILAAKIGTNLTIAGKTFGTPSVGTVPDFKAVKISAALVADPDTTKAGKYAPLTIAGVDITTAYTTHAALVTALSDKALALQAAGYTVSLGGETAEVGGVPAFDNITVTALNKGKISTAVGDRFRINSKDSFQLEVATTSGTDAVPGYADKAALEAQIKTTKFDNFTAEVTEPNATDVQVVLTQIAGKTYTQAVEGSDTTLYTTGTATVTRAGTGTGVVSNGFYNGYTNKSAAYIDVDKTANIRVYNGSKMVKVDEFDEDANDDGVKATVVDSTTIAQDKDYIYRVIGVRFTGTTSTVKLYNSKGTTAIFDTATSTDNRHVYLQKISKAQGETEKDAYLPKTVESYEIDGTVSDDAATAETELGNLLSGSDKTVGVRVVDGGIYYTEMSGDTKIKTYYLKLQKNEKVEAKGSTEKVDAYVVKKDGDTDNDLKGEARKAGASFDVNGNLWIVNEGKIYESVKAGDFVEKFTCDRSIDSLDVYDEGSLIAWDKSGDAYTTFQEGTKVTQGEATAVAPVVVTGWVQGTDGTWTFNDITGTKLVSKWINPGGVWYYLKADGIMATGWYQDGATWYFLQPSGAMVTGWYNDNGTWYYLNASGAMLANTTVDGYVLGASGAWIQ